MRRPFFFAARVRRRWTWWFFSVLALGALAGCDTANDCARSCDSYMESFGGGVCKCIPPEKRPAKTSYPSTAESFCDSCAKRCAPAKAHVCKFGNDTWGAGPDVCECEVRP